MEYNELEEYDEYYDELEEYEEEQEISSDVESTKVTNGQVKFKCVNYAKRTEKYGRISDGNVTKYANYALEYFGHRCALSGEKFYNFDEKIAGRKSNLSLEHIIALAIGGHDIVPNIVPTVLQYNIQKNGYYILDWWEKQKDINGKDIYSPYRLLKLVNFMMKSIEGRGLSARKYHELLMKPNEIDKYLEKIEKEDLEETDNSKRKILSDTETTTTIDGDNKKILTKIPLAEGNIIDQVEDSIKRKEYAEKEMMDTFLIDAVRIIQKEKDIAKEEIETENGNKITIEEKLEEMLSKTIGEIPFEVNVRNKILEQLEEIGIENNKYTVANVIFKNTDILYKARNKEEINIKEIIQTRMENILPQITQEQKNELISVIPDLLYDDNAVKEYEDNLKWYSEYKNVNIEEVNPILFTKIYFINAIKIKKWMEDNNTTKPPVARSKNEEEKKLGRALATIRQTLIKSYNLFETEEEKVQYKKEHPELEEVMQIVEQIDRNNIKIKEESAYYINAIKIKKWMEDNNTTKPPVIRSKNEEEKKLGRALATIRQNLIKPYKELETEEEKVQYKKEQPELEEVMQIIEEIDRNNIKIKIKIKNKEESAYYINAIKIKKWMEDNNTTKPPSQVSKNEEEKKLGIALATIRQKLIKPYKELKTEEEKVQYKKEQPELEEVMQIIEEIDRNNLHPYVINAREIKKWMEYNNTTKPPSRKSKNEEEKKLGNALSNIRQNLIKPYKELQTEEKEQYKIEHPELEEAMKIVEEIDRNNPKNISKKVKEVIVENKQEMHNNVEIAKEFSNVIKEVEKEEQNYGRE